MNLFRYLQRRALLAAGRDLMARWCFMVKHLGGNPAEAEALDVRLVLYLRAARRFAYRAALLKKLRVASDGPAAASGQS